jgi:hypothetical protein
MAINLKRTQRKKKVTPQKNKHIINQIFLPIFLKYIDFNKNII